MVVRKHQNCCVIKIFEVITRAGLGADTSGYVREQGFDRLRRCLMGNLILSRIAWTNFT